MQEDDNESQLPRMSGPIKHWFWAGIGLVGICFLGSFTPSFDECKDRSHEQAAKEGRPNSPENVSDWMGELLKCEAVAAEANNGLFVALFTLGLVVYTARLFGATADLVKGADKTAQRQLRAYVALNNLWDEEKRTDIRIQNYGKTPAHQVTLRINGVSGAAPMSYVYVDGAAEPEQMLHPTQEYTYYRIRPELSLVNDKLVNDKFVWGSIVYRDAFDKWWETQFCYTLKFGKGNFVVHGEHNRECGPYDNRPF